MILMNLDGKKNGKNTKKKREKRGGEKEPHNDGESA